ncbi:hypothetical protein ACP4OV_019946 [Aristida adscensionis]
MAIEATGDWSSLPADVANNIAGRFLATNDLDWYMAFRAVCHHWRAATADPKTGHDPRFRPTRWIMLDEPEDDSTNDDRLFVNTTTGRFLRRSLPLLRDYHVISTTTGGFVVLADRASPHAARVLNPFTGSLVRFLTAMPPTKLQVTAAVVGSLPTLVLVSVSCNMAYWADPQSESFRVQMMPVRCPACADPMAIVAGSKAGSFVNLSGSGDSRRYVVEAADGEVFGVLKQWHHIDVFRIDSAGNITERVKNIGSRALFIGIRCLVDADVFPTIDANCVYFQLTDVGTTAFFPWSGCHIVKYRLEIEEGEEELELVALGIDYADKSCYRRMRPFTILQLVSNYTMDIPCHRLVRRKKTSRWYDEDSSEDDDTWYSTYIDKFDDDESD